MKITTKDGLKRLGIILSIFVVVIFVNQVKKPNNPVCPDDFDNSEEKTASFSKWVDDYFDKNPNASISDMGEARRDFYVKNNCTKALKRNDDYLLGRVDKETKQLMEMIIKEELLKARQ